jgi:hypothetical protein
MCFPSVYYIHGYWTHFPRNVIKHSRILPIPGFSLIPQNFSHKYYISPTQGSNSTGGQWVLSTAPVYKCTSKRALVQHRYYLSIALTAAIRQLNHMQNNSVINILTLASIRLTQTKFTQSPINVY